jgi:conjugal transfer pilus assembly protein TraV
MNTVRLIAAALTSASILAGCGSLSGLDASSSFGCKAAPGVTCQSISGVHQNASAGNLPFQRTGEGNGKSPESNARSEDEKPQAYGSNKTDSNTKVSPRDMNAASSGMPVRQPPLVLRVWMAPFEDETGDLHDQSYFYTMVHSGRWMIEANRSTITNQFRPIYPLNRPTQSQEAPIQEKEVQPLVQKGEYDQLVEKPELK